MTIAKMLRMLTVVALAMQGNAYEQVRTELTREQLQTGLSLVSFYRQIHVVNFSMSSIKEEQINIQHGYPLQGALSKDGELIAMEVSLEKPFQKYLVVSRIDGKGFREYPNVRSPGYLCWSNNKARLTVNVADRKLIHGSLVILDLAAGTSEPIAEGAYVSTQCWSPDDSELVYGFGSSIRVMNISGSESRELVQGENPAWSPDGQWIAFRDGDFYYAIRPSGSGKKLLFKSEKARGGPWWSPDGNLIAYLRSGNHEFKDSGLSARQLCVRRLRDGAEYCPVEDADVEHSPRYQWVYMMH